MMGDICTKFHNYPSNSCWHISLKTTTLWWCERKSQSDDSSSGNHECLYNFLCQSVKWILCYFFTGYVKALTCRCHWMTSQRITEISQSSFGEENVCPKLHGNPYPDISVWTKVVTLPSGEPAQIEISQYGSPVIGWARWPWYRGVFSWVINPSGGLTPSLKQTDQLKVVILGCQKILTLIWSIHMRGRMTINCPISGLLLNPDPWPQTPDSVDPETQCEEMASLAEQQAERQDVWGSSSPPRSITL